MYQMFATLLSWMVLHARSDTIKDIEILVPRHQLIVLQRRTRHLRRVLAAYANHDNSQRPHRALQLRPPRRKSPVSEPVHGKIRRRPLLGGLLNQYEPAA
jgi:hypothetical protein